MMSDAQCTMSTDSILLLPVDILVNIFKKLKLSDLRNLMLTCKALNNFIKNDNTIWRSLSGDMLILQDCTDRRQINKLSWYNRCRISYNWSNGCYRSKVVLHHYTNYMPWLKFHNSKALIVSVGSELHCYPTNNKGFPNCREATWKLDVPKIKRHDVRTNDISRFVLKNYLLVCGNRDGCVAVYRVNNTQKRPRLQCHLQDCLENGEVEVTAVEVIDGRSQVFVITGSNDSCNLRLFSLGTEEEILTAANDQKSVMNVSMYERAGTKCMALNSTEDKLAIGLNGNSKPLLLDVNKAQFLITADETKNPKQAVRDIGWHNQNTIIYVTHSGYLHLIDIRSHEVVYSTRDPFQSTLYCVKSDGQHGIIVGSAEYSRCVLFDSRNRMHHVQMYFTQRKASPVYSLDFDSSKLITAVDRGVAVLDFNIDASFVQQRDYSHIFY